MYYFWVIIPPSKVSRSLQPLKIETLLFFSCRLCDCRCGDRVRDCSGGQRQGSGCKSTAHCRQWRNGFRLSGTVAMFDLCFPSVPRLGFPSTLAAACSYEFVCVYVCVCKCVASFSDSTPQLFIALCIKAGREPGTFRHATCVTP